MDNYNQSEHIHDWWKVLGKNNNLHLIFNYFTLFKNKTFVWWLYLDIRPFPQDELPQILVSVVSYDISTLGKVTYAWNPYIATFIILF